MGLVNLKFSKWVGKRKSYFSIALYVKKRLPIFANLYLSLSVVSFIVKFSHKVH